MAASMAMRISRNGPIFSWLKENISVASESNRKLSLWQAVTKYQLMQWRSVIGCTLHTYTPGHRRMAAARTGFS